MRTKEAMRDLIQSLICQAQEEAWIEEIGNPANKDKRNSLDERLHRYHEEVFAAQSRVAFFKPQVMEQILDQNYLKGVNK